MKIQKENKNLLRCKGKWKTKGEQQVFQIASPAERPQPAEQKKNYMLNMQTYNVTKE